MFQADFGYDPPVISRQSLMGPVLRKLLPTLGPALWLAAAPLFGLAPLGGMAEAQARLGTPDATGQLRLPLPAPLPVSRLRVEVDGQAVDAALALSGRDLIVTLPPGLTGSSHDIVLYRIEPGADVELGIWRFDTPTGATDITLTGRLELAARSGPAGRELALTGSGRIGFERDGGRWRGAIGFLQDQDDTTRNPRTEITDYFLEHRGALLGDALIARIGTQDLPGETLAMDDSARRGLSLRLQDPGGRSDFAVFALSPNAESSRRNLTGLENGADRVSGVAAQVRPFAGRGFQVDLLAYGGRATDVSGRRSDVAGRGLRLSGPLSFLPNGAFELGYAQTEDQQMLDGFPLTLRDEAWTAEISTGLLPEGDERSLSLILDGAETGGDVIAALNPDLLGDTRSAGVTLLWQSPFWQWQAEARRGRTNVDDLPGLPTENLRDLAFDLYFLPDDFTGGPLNGMTFFASAAREAQSRRRSPVTGPAPQDFRIDSLSFGMDKFQPDYAWALSVNLEHLAFTGTNAAPGTGDRDLWLEGLYAWTPDDRTTLTLGGEIGTRRINGTGHDRAAIEFGYGWDLAPDRWSALIEGGASRDAAPDGEYGAWFGAELARQISPSSQMVLRADYGRGSEAPDLAPEGGWVMGLALRHDLGGRK